MPLSPADFYAYSRATGAPVADTPEERARQAPDVYAFRQSQLQSYQQPAQQDFNVLDAIGKTALAAGALAGGIGLYRGLRGKRAVPEVKTPGTPATAPSVRQPVERVANLTKTAPTPSQAPPTTRPVAAVVTEAKPNLGVQITDLGNIARPTAVESTPVLKITSAPVKDPWQGAATVPSSQSFLHQAVQPSEEVLDRLAEDYEQRAAANIAGQHVGETMVDQHNAETLQHSYQSVAAVNSAEDQMTGRMKYALQQNPHLDMSQVEVLEDIAEHNYHQGMEQPSSYPAFDTSENYPSDSAINIAATQTTGRVPNDQAEGNAASSAQRFLARERMEIASQLGEQNLPVSPGRIEAELNLRLGSQASEYGPYYTRRKQALQMGATYGEKFFENVNEQNVNVAGVNFPASSSDFRQAVLNEDTATRAEDYVTRRRNQQKDWLGNIRLEAEPKINQILVERQNIARETAGKLKEQQAALLAAGDTQGAAYAERQIQNMREIWKDPFLGQHREDEMKKLSAQVNRASGKAYKNMEDIQKRFPTALANDVDENKRIFFQTSSPKGTKVDMSMLDPTWEDINEPVEDVVLSMGDINPYTVELRSGRRPTVENVGAYGENLEPQKMQAASGTAIRGVSGIPFITESSAEPMSASAAEQSRKAAYVASLQPVEKTLEETQKQSAQKFVDKYKGGIGLYGEVVEGYPEGAVTETGEYTELAKQQPSLVYNKYGEVDQAANAPSTWSQYSDEALNEMSLMGNPRMKHMAQKTLMQRESVRASENARLGRVDYTSQAVAAKTGGKRLAAALIDHKERTGQPLRPENAVDFAASIAQQEGTDVNSVLREANNYSRSLGQTSEWTLISKAAAEEANKYFPSAGETVRNRRQEQVAPPAPQQANLQQAAARTLFSSVPDERQQAGVQHLANYISSAAKRVDQPLTWQGNTKLKGVGNNALMPYSPPSEGMIQALMLQARRR